MSGKEEKIYNVITNTGSILALCSTAILAAVYIWKRGK